MTFGTAGHIDHGKSSLIYALTSIDPDRLPEEKRRGMTIDLGFAWLELPSGETVGLVDVPGHKHFIRNVIPGLTGIDAALLVVAADDGWMPQTEEHVQIIDLLGIGHGIVALTKIDLVDDAEWLGLVEKDIRNRIDQTSLKGAPIVKVSSRHGHGLDELKEAIGRLAAQVAARKDIGKPFLPIDRVFTIKGSGVVVTGTLSGGSFAPGDEVVISPRNRPAHIRSVESYKQRSHTARPGSRVALNLSGVKKDDLGRGDVIFAAGHVPAVSGIIDVQLKLLPQLDSPLKNNSEVAVYLGTSELLARVRLLEAKTAAPAASVLAQLILSGDAVPYIGERFIIRRQSPPQTIGGGVVLDPQAAKHHLKDAAAAAAFLKRRLGLGLEELILSEVAKSKYTARKDLLLASGFSSKEIADCVAQLKDKDRLVATASLVIDAGYWQRQVKAALSILGKEHSHYPLKEGLSRAELQSRLALPREVFNHLLDSLVTSGQVVRREDAVALASHKPKLSPPQERLVSKIMALFKESGSSPPDRKELIQKVPGAEGVVR
ncbi:MAG: selenocysteine-specific translation elongation factor, partial [Dehalococcoidales bacterium]